VLIHFAKYAQSFVRKHLGFNFMSQIKSLKEVSTFHLMIELLYEGNAQIISEIESMEPFDMKELLSELRQRSGNDFDDNIDMWCDWFLSDSNSDDEVCSAFSLLKRNKEQTDYYVAKINKNRDSRR